MTDQDLLLLGASRTGKTNAVIEAAADQARRWGAAAVLIVTPTRWSARVLQAAVAQRIGGLAPRVVTPVALANDIVSGTIGEADEELRLLTAAEQESRVREILAGTVDTHSVAWPPAWKEALGTRTFARQLRRAVARVRALGWEPADLEAEARAHGDELWAAVAAFTAEYLQVLDWEGALDYGEVLLRAVRLLEGGRRPIGGLRALLVDDLHDLDPMQLRLLRAHAGGGASFLATADPDQSLAGVRGADTTVLGQYLEGRVGHPARVSVLTSAFGLRPELRDARTALMGVRWYPGLPVSAAAAHRTPALLEVPPPGPGRSRVVVARDGFHQGRLVAAELRSHHRAGVPWRDMAVLAAGASELAELVRALGDARIPVHVRSDDLPLPAQPATALLLSAARAVCAWNAQTLTDRELIDLVVGYHAATPSGLRALGRRLQGSLLDAARTPKLLEEVPADLKPACVGLQRVATVLAEAARLERSAARPAEVLWGLWEGSRHARTGWPQRLARLSAGAGRAGIAADRDLDAVLQLFRLAERAPERWGGSRGLAAFVEEVEHQEVPSEPDLAGQSYRDQVSVMALQRSKGRVWPVVVVTGAHERAWPAGVGRGDLLGIERLTPETLLDQPIRRPGEQRRLLAFALSRATSHILLVAGGGPESAPLPLLAELGLPTDEPGPLPETPSVSSLIARLRDRGLSSVPSDPRDLAMSRLLATATDPTAAPLFPGADPRRWPGVCDWTVAEQPIRPVDQPLRLSASAIASIDGCPLRWFLGREVDGGRPMSTFADFGLLVHEALAHVITAANEGRPLPTSAELLERWSEIGYDAAWHGDRERILADGAIRRGMDWISQRAGTLACEVPIDVLVPVAGGEPVRIRGSVDVLETGERGSMVWDFKTRRARPSRSEAEQSAQLATYQVAVGRGANRPVAGAGLVHVCLPTGKRDDGALVLTQPRQDPTDPASTAAGLLRRAAETVRAEEFGPQPSADCRTCDFRALCPATGGSGR